MLIQVLYTYKNTNMISMKQYFFNYMLPFVLDISSFQFIVKIVEKWRKELQKIHKFFFLHHLQHVLLGIEC